MNLRSVHVGRKSNFTRLVKLSTAITAVCLARDRIPYKIILGKLLTTLINKLGKSR